MKAVSGRGTQFVAVKVMLDLGPLPDEGGAKPKRLYGVEDPDHFHHGIDVAMRLGKGGTKGGIGFELVVPIGFADIAFRRLVGAQQANKIDNASERAHGESPARISQQENAVTGAVMRCQPAIGALDLTVYAAPFYDVQRRPPV